MSEPQFERMESSTDAAAGACAGCGRSIPDTYYEAAGKIFCEPCRNGVMTSLQAGSGVSRMVKALLLGSVAAALSAVVWYAVVKLTGYELGIIAVAVGVAVGGAVRMGAERRGGWAYQTLAVALTYLAIAASYVPWVIEEFESKSAAAAAHTDDAQAEVAPAAASGDAPPASRAAVLVGAIVLSVMIPVLQVMDGGFIGLLIVLFALYEAWKINKRQTIAFSGPFRLQRSAAQGTA